MAETSLAPSRLPFRTGPRLALLALAVSIVLGTITAAGTLDPGMVLAPSGLAALAIVAGLIMGWIAATLVCGVLVTLLDIRDDINDRLPRAK